MTSSSNARSRCSRHGDAHLFQQMFAQRRFVRPSCGRESSSSGAFEVRATSSKLQSVSPEATFPRRPKLSNPPSGSAGAGALASSLAPSEAVPAAPMAPSASKRTGVIERIVDPLQQRIVGQDLFQFLMQFQRRQLQQADRLLQLRRERQMLRDAKLEGLFHARPILFYIRKCSPRYTRRTDSFGDDVIRSAAGQHRALVDDVGAVANAQGFPHVVIGDQDADAAFLQEADDALDFDHGDRIDAGKWFIQQDEARIGRQCAGDFDPTAFTAGERQVPDFRAAFQFANRPARYPGAVSIAASAKALPFSRCSSSTARILSSTLSLRNTEASCGR